VPSASRHEASLRRCGGKAERGGFRSPSLCPGGAKGDGGATHSRHCEPEAKQPRGRLLGGREPRLVGCFVAALLAMTVDLASAALHPGGGLEASSPVPGPLTIAA